MKDFKIRKVEQDHHRMLVEIEFLKGGDRRQFGYPLGEGWENKINNEYRFITQIRETLEKEDLIEKSVVIDSLKKVVEGKTFKNKNVKK